MSGEKSAGSGSVISKTGLQVLWSLFMLGLFAVVVLFIQITISAETKSIQKQSLSSLLKTDISTTLAVLRASQGVLASITSITLKQSFLYLQWSLTNHAEGLSYLNLLALAPTTGYLGTIMLMGAKVRLYTRLWAFFRLALMSAVWLSGLVLFFNTSIITVYDTATTYNVTAGVGPFNGSYVQPFIDFLHSLAPQYQYQILPYTYFAVAYSLVVNPIFCTVSSPIRCQQNETSGNACMSYLLSGGLEMATPWTPLTTQDYPMIKIDDVTSIQLDFTRGIRSDIFSDTDCDVFGETGFAIGVRFCVAEDPSNIGSLNAGLYVCTNGTDAGICNVADPIPKPNITTTVSFYRRQATVIAVRSNYSITSIADLSPPDQVTDIDLPAYRSALRWLLNFTADNVPPPSAIIESFWGADDQLKDPYTYGVLLQNFQSVLAFPVWLFNANNFGNTALKKNQIITSLPPEFYTVASIVAPYDKIKFNSAMVVLFIVLQGVAMLFVWGVLFWVLFWVGVERLPNMSSYDLFDVALKTEVKGVQGTQNEVLKAESSEVIRIVKGARVHMKAD